MTQPIPSETIEYERYVDGLRLENSRLRTALVQSSDFAAHVLKAKIVEVNPSLGPWIEKWKQALDSQDTGPTSIITVHIEGGMVQDVTGMPPGMEVHVHDHDEGDRSHPSWDAEKRCFVTVYGGDGV